jgi:hypothetical protein
MLSYRRERENPSGSFRRQHERKYYNADIVFAINDRIYQGCLRDISVGGAFIHTKHADLLLEGDMATISIPFTRSHKHIKRKGRILWKNSTGFAVSFAY